ncbi:MULTISPECIES: MFS transporter [Paracoccus]|uniref:MFS transporter n=1 Tax=Paracoccus TaxID=265 RepID=UPI001F062C26|nr:MULTISPECIES: MFS transporter [Paracoccus]
MPVTDHSLQRGKLIISTCFFAGGIGIGAWGANLPALGRRTGMSESQIGVVLLCFAAGAILAMNMTPRFIARFGAQRISLVAAGLFGVGIGCVGLAMQIWTAAILAALCGMAFGTVDVAMNKHAAELEAQADRPIMSFFHAMFSGGTLAAAVAYALLSRWGMPSPLILVSAALLIVALAGAALWRTDRPAPIRPEAHHSSSSSSGPRLIRVLMLGAMAFVIFFAEGAIMDWAALYLVRVMGTTESTGALGYAVFGGAMMLGRLTGDRANRMLGPVRLFRLGTACVALFLTLMLLAPSVWVALTALALCGLGAANVIPIIFSAAGQFSARDGGRAMSRVLTMGYAGILIGPALIGFIAEAWTLRASLVLVALAVGMSCLGGGILRGNVASSRL